MDETRVVDSGETRACSQSKIDHLLDRTRLAHECAKVLADQAFEDEEGSPVVLADVEHGDT